MSRWLRREFLQMIGAASAYAAFPGFARGAQKALGRGQPRAFIHLAPLGGMDAALTTDPKLRNEVEPEIDVPYESSEILKFGDVRVGPHMAHLASLVPQMAILNGVRCSTVSHPTGEARLRRMRSKFPDQAPALTTILGMLRPAGCPLAAVHFVDERTQDMTPSTGPRLTINYKRHPQYGLLERFSRIVRNDPQRKILEQVVADEVARCGDAPECMPIQVTEALLRNMPREALPPAQPLPIQPSPALRDFTGAPDWEPWSWIVRDIAFLLSHRLTPAIFVQCPMGLVWDSHYDNRWLQRMCMEVFSAGFNHLVSTLRATKAPEGHAVLDEVVILVGSEIGRFPVLNNHQGKDHFPEVPMMFMGKGIRPGAYGQTDRRASSTPVSRQTGRPSSSPKDFAPTIDDVGVTLLNLFGIEDTSSLGYFGRRLDFLLS
jgi:hypothetical protein